MVESQYIDNNTQEAPERSGNDALWYAGCFLITVISALLRFASLSLKPLHHDEGVNGWFLTTLFRDGTYKYDPANYHGPTLYYISLGFAKVFGLETFSIRASVAVWGVLTVILAFYLRKYIGKVGSLSAALFIGLSPGMVYISRYFIHEMFFVFLSLALVVSIVLFIERERAGMGAIVWTALVLLVCFFPSAFRFADALGRDNQTAVWAFRGGFLIVEAILVVLVIRMLLAWNQGRPIYLLLAAASASLMFATKETAFITLGTMVIACVCILVWQKIFKPSEANVNSIDDRFLTWSNFRSSLGGGTDLLLIVVASAVVFIYIAALFFSSFFTYPEGVKGAIDAYAIWAKTGSKDHTQNGIWAYVEWGKETETPIMLLSALGALIAFVKARHRFAMFVGLWAFGLFAAYTIIPYKTPWLAISFLLPMCIAAGYAINELVTSSNLSQKMLGGVLAVTATAVLAYQSYDLNFVRYDDEDMAYVYAHTHRQFHDLIGQIEHYAEKSGRGKDTKIEIVSPDYWPMVWYLREYTQANFHGQMIDKTDGELIVAKKGQQDTEVIRKFSAKYLFVGPYHLRSGVDLVLLVRRDIADADAKELYLIPQTEIPPVR